MNCRSNSRFIKRSSFFWQPSFFWLPSLYKKLFFESSIDLKTYWCVNVLPFHYQFLLSSSSIQISNRNLFFPRFLSPFLLILSLLVEMRTSKHIYNICISHTYRIYVIYCSRIETGSDIWTYRDDKMISTVSQLCLSGHVIKLLSIVLLFIK